MKIHSNILIHIPLIVFLRNISPTFSKDWLYFAVWNCKMWKMNPEVLLKHWISSDELKYIMWCLFVDSPVRNHAEECPGTAVARSNGELLREPWCREVCTDLSRRVWHTWGYLECRDEASHWQNEVHCHWRCSCCCHHHHHHHHHHHIIIIIIIGILLSVRSSYPVIAITNNVYLVL